jgi:signal transduction histidine kinase
MARTSMPGLDKKRLRLWLLLFFLALAIPTAILIHQAYSELKWEAFHQHRVLAEELSGRINDRLVELILEEEARPFADYAFLNVAGDPAANLLQRSPLSAYPVKSTIPGLIGYFQVDTKGFLSTPLLPANRGSSMGYGIPKAEQQQRLALQNRVQQILSDNRLVQIREEVQADSTPIPVEPHSAGATAGAVVPESTEEDEDGATARWRRYDLASSTTSETTTQEIPAQAAFDRLNTADSLRGKEKKRVTSKSLGRVEDLQLDQRYQLEPADKVQQQLASEKAPALKKGPRKELSTLPVPSAPAVLEEQESFNSVPSVVRIRTFESEIDPFEFSLLDSGHFVLFRKVWRDGQRYIQGALIEQRPFLEGVVKSSFDETTLSRMSDLIVAYQGNVFSAFSGQKSRGYLSSTEELTGSLLFRTRFSDPMGDLELIYSINHLPSGPGASVVTWVATILLLVLCSGFYLMYRLGAKQIELTRQQQDFVSAVSHELKTPLTSIRMYGELLREGWASEEKKKSYYDFISDESERLSRLINNVLQLARLTRNRVQAEMKPVSVTELIDNLRSKVSSQIERAGFELNLNCDEAVGDVNINVDVDHFVQIIINLVDNALKFAARAEKRIIDINCTLRQDKNVVFAIRDYGPGVPKDQMKKIFKLFYRSENELTRETVGTGIGLALVHQLAQKMNGQVDVVNRDPGAEFQLSLPLSGKQTTA